VKTGRRINARSCTKFPTHFRDAYPTLAVRPSLGADVSPDDQAQIADWELFTLHGKYLRVGPGLKWAYLATGSQESDSKVDLVAEGR
jgi:hypothetical protein